MNTPQSSIQLTASECREIARKLLTHAEMLEVARPDSAIVAAAQVSLRGFSVRLGNASVMLCNGLLTTTAEDEE
jgi:hypothetical protein